MNADEAIQKIDDRTAKVVVVGQGYVGLPVAMRAVEVGFGVIGFEASTERVDALLAGESYVGDISDEELTRALHEGYVPTADPVALEGFDVAVISVPTPLRDGLPDLSYIEHAGRDLAGYMRPGCCVILESTTYPGTTTELLAPILAEGSGLAEDEFFVGYSPERIDPGNPTHGLVNTPKVVSGSTPDGLAVVDAFFSTLVDETVPVGSCAEAELVKLLENTFRHVNIALVNELAMFARDLGVDVWRAIDAAATKPFGYMKFTPGPGVGGHCLPIDPSYLAWRVKQHLGHTFRFVELANDVNEHMPDYVHDRVTAMLNRERKSVNGSRVLLLGLAYKKATSDWRESPSVHVASRLSASGADVRFCDPYIPEVNALHLADSLVPFSTDELAAADVVVVLVDHPEFDAAVIAEHAQLVFDTKNLLGGHEFVGELLEPMSGEEAVLRTRVLYLLTDEISSVLVRGQLGHLVEAGFEVTVAARRSVPGEAPEPGKWDGGVTVEHLPFVREPSPLADLRALWATVRLIRRLRPTIVNASTPKAGLLGMLAAWLCRVPVRVYVVRGFRFETATGWRRRLFRSLEWVAIRCANHVIFNSRSLMTIGEAEGLIPPERGEVIGGGSGNGIDVSRFADDVLPTRAEARRQLGLPDEATVVGFVGRFTRDKGIADLVEVFTSARDQRPGVWLLLVGQFEEGDPVAATVRSTIEDDERIVTVPWLDHPGVAYRAMNLLAFPSYREGLPNVPLEAQLCGVPVVGYAATGTVDAVAPGSVLVPVGDVQALGEEIVAQVAGEIGRSSSERQEAAWVVENFDRARLWSGLVDRYRSWVMTS